MSRGELAADEEGVVFRARDTMPPRVETVVDGRVLHRVPWGHLVAVEACDPWPRARITYRGVHGEENEEVVPSDEPPARFASAVAELFAVAEQHAPHARRVEGWLAAPDVDWERVKRMPHDLPDTKAQGAYRTTEASRVETVRAHRLPRPPLAGFLDWLASHPGFAFREQPLEVVLTDDDAYARFRDATTARVALAHLRTALRGPRGEVVYVFGRRARLLLPHVEGCDVERLLDARLCPAADSDASRRKPR